MDSKTLEHLGNVRKEIYELLKLHGVDITPELHRELKELLGKYAHIAKFKMSQKYSRLKNPQDPKKD